ncbi:MAG: type II secretion system protein [Kiritimatiellia bacterium]
MKTENQRRKAVRPQAAFTLIELLVVLAILGILMAMMVPAAGIIMKRTKISNTRGDAGVVATILLKYRAEYNRWPSVYVPDVNDRTDKDWVAIMCPPADATARPKDNFKLIAFMEQGGAAFVDAWGMPFKFRLDQTGNGEMANPNVEIGGVLKTQVAVWSAGPDGDFDTWADNVAGWE